MHSLDHIRYTFPSATIIVGSRDLKFRRTLKNSDTTHILAPVRYTSNAIMLYWR